MAHLHVVILNWQRAAATLDCLRQVTSWSTLQPTVWVVDNASADDSLAHIRQHFPTIHLLASPHNLGFAGGNNLAFQLILATNLPPDSFILLLNNDATIEETAVNHLIEQLEQRPDIGMIGPLFRHGEEIVAAGGRDIARHIVTHLKPSQLDPDLLTSDRPYPVTYVSGTVALLRTNLLREIGLLDETYFFSGEMADWGERLRLAGYRCAIAPGATAQHDTHQAGSLRTTLYAYYILRNRFRFIRKFRSGQRGRLFLFWLAFGLATLLRAGLRGQWATVWATYLALWDGLTGQLGNQNHRVSR